MFFEEGEMSYDQHWRTGDQHVRELHRQAAQQRELRSDAAKVSGYGRVVAVIARAGAAGLERFADWLESRPAHRPTTNRSATARHGSA